jgi:hypothetical protein
MYTPVQGMRLGQRIGQPNSPEGRVESSVESPGCIQYQKDEMDGYLAASKLSQ